MNTGRWLRPLGVVVLALAAAGCASNPPSPVTAIPPTINASPSPEAEAPVPGTSLPATTEPAPTQAEAQNQPVFTVAVIVDTLSEPVTREQAAAAVTEASSLLRPLTSINLLLTDFAEDAAGGSSSDMASRYIAAHEGALPNGLVILSFGDEGRARLEGGYNFAIAGPPGFRNAFASPVSGDGHLYVAVIHFGQRYAPCGYGGGETLQSATALGDECRNQPGMACIEHNGNSMCADSVPHLYASTPSYHVASTIVHELLHSFSAGGDSDHYSTAECNTRMGYPPQFRDLQEDQYNNGLCPHVYAEFARSYRP